MTNPNLAPTTGGFLKKVLAVTGGQGFRSRRDEKQAAERLAGIQRVAEHRAISEQIHLTEETARMVGRTALASQAIQEIITLSELEEQVRQAAPMAAVRTAAIVNGFVAAAQFALVKY